MSELAQQFNLHPNQIKQWKDQLLGNVQGVFDGSAKPETPAPVDVKELHAKIGQLTLENDFCPVCACRRHRQGRCVAERRTMIERDHKLSLTRQAALLGISRGSVYYQPALCRTLISR